VRVAELEGLLAALREQVEASELPAAAKAADVKGVEFAIKGENR
jgi:hypothetical protein